jgi:DNA-binding response OmpR family regulator
MAAPFGSERFLSTVAAENRPPTQPGDGKLRGTSVLIVEDDDDIRDLVAVIIEQEGGQIALALDGQDGLRQALATPFDAILLDLYLPRLDGFEVARAFRAAGRHEPIIAMTAAALSQESERCFQTGFDDYMTKPFTRKSLVDAVVRCLARH